MKNRVVSNGTKSTWKDAINGLPQGSKLRALLFFTYIIDLGLGIKSKVSIFSDDRKLASIVINGSDNHKVQSDLDI